MVGMCPITVQPEILRAFDLVLGGWINPACVSLQLRIEVFVPCIADIVKSNEAEVVVGSTGDVERRQWGLVLSKS